VYVCGVKNEVTGLPASDNANCNLKQNSMKKLALLFLVVFSASLYAQETGIKFSKDSLLSDALAQSKKEGKLVFIDCYTTWCGPCKRLAKEIFPQKEVGDFYNSHFINLSFDMEKGEGLKIRAKYAVQAYPTLLFLNAQGETVHVGIGSMEANAFIELGKTALDDTRNVLSISNKMKTGDKSIQTLLLYLKTNHYAADADALITEYFKTATDEEKLSQDAWQLFKEHITDIDNDQFQYFLKHRPAYEQKFGKTEVGNKIINGFSYSQPKYKDNPAKEASVKSIDTVLYSKYMIIRSFMLASYEQQTNKTDKAKWDEYIAKTKAFIPLDNVQPMDINNICWNIYENYRTFNDTPTLKLAKEWQEKAHKALPDNHPINDTYAHLLFDLGFVKEAIEHEELAIKGATKENSTGDLKFYNDEVERFKKVK
jgi:thioredoxin-related protein